MHTVERIAGRLVQIELGEVEGLGWVAVGVVKGGLHHEQGMLFEAKSHDPTQAENRLRAEIEAFFA